MNDAYTKIIAADATIAEVWQAATDLQFEYMDAGMREIFRQPTNLKLLKRSRDQLDSVIRKLEFDAVRAPVIDGVSRRVESQKELASANS